MSDERIVICQKAQRLIDKLVTTRFAIISFEITLYLIPLGTIIYE